MEATKELYGTTGIKSDCHTPCGGVEHVAEPVIKLRWSMLNLAGLSPHLAILNKAVPAAFFHESLVPPESCPRASSPGLLMTGGGPFEASEMHHHALAEHFIAGFVTPSQFTQGKC